MDPSTLYADTILNGGNLITMDPSIPLATALAIRNGRIVWVGGSQEVTRFIGSNTKILDLQGNFVYPGFIETHMHVLFTGIVQSYLQLHKCAEKSSVLEEVEKAVKGIKKGEWIIGVGWDDTHWSQGHPTAQDLDAIAPDNPIALLKKDTHLLWVNNCALRLAGIDKSIVDVEGGKIEKDAIGVPTGILIDKAKNFVRDKMPLPDNECCLSAIQQTIDNCLQMGITTIHNAATDDQEFEAFKHLAFNNQLKARIYLFGAIKDKENIAFLELSPQKYHPLLQFRCLKLWMDGALGSHGAALFENYLDKPGCSGLLIWREDDFLSILQKAKSQGFQVATHAIGDLANHLVLNAYEKVGVEGLRWRIEHAQQLIPTDVCRFKKLGVIAAMQPLHAIEDMTWLENRLGKDRIESGAFLWRSLLDSGAVIVGGSDAPVACGNPLWGMYAAVTRQDLYQKPKDGWYPKQKITMVEALKMYTSDAAYASFQEHELGSITPGKFADLVVLPMNILKCQPYELLDMKVLYTFVNGELRYSQMTKPTNLS